MTTPLPFEYPTLLGLPTGTIDDLAPGRVAVFGASEATPTTQPRQAIRHSRPARSGRRRRC